MARKKKTKTSAAKTKEKQQEKGASTDAKKQKRALIMLAIAVLTFCMAIIEGENVWTLLHNVLLGLFSFSAYVLPVGLGVYAVLMAFDKDTRSVKIRMWECLVFVVMLMSAVFTYMADVADEGFFSSLGKAYTDGCSARGGGVFGALFGYPAEAAFGDTGAKIVLILLMAVSFMLVTGTTIVHIVRALRKPAEKAKEVGISAVVFDRGGFQYHGKIKAIDDAAREVGLTF